MQLDSLGSEKVEVKDPQTPGAHLACGLDSEQ